jgi:hypothetical protein
MKHIKLFETYQIPNNSDKVNLNDYVILSFNDERTFVDSKDIIFEYIENNIGKIVDKYRDDYNKQMYDIKYDNVPKRILLEVEKFGKADDMIVYQDTFTMYYEPFENIKYVSDSKEDLNIYM